MRRRQFLGVIGGAASSWPSVARAQQPNNLRRVGLLPTGYRQTDPEGEARVTAFLDTFHKLGWSDGRNVRVEVRWLSHETEQIEVETKALVQSAPDVIVISSNAAVAALQKLDSKIPAVFVQVSDPVGGGFVSSLSRPDGNITGFQNFETAMGGKWLGLLKEAAPGVARAAVVVYPDTGIHREFLRAAEAVAPSLGVKVSAINFENRDDIARDIAGFAGAPNGGLIVLPHPIASFAAPGRPNCRSRRRQSMIWSSTSRAHTTSVLPFHRRCSAARPKLSNRNISESGTKQTNRAGLTMSLIGVERRSNFGAVSGQGSEFDPKRKSVATKKFRPTGPPHLPDVEFWQLYCPWSDLWGLNAEARFSLSSRCCGSDEADWGS